MGPETGLRIRLLTEQDLPVVCDIVNHYIEHTPINLRVRPQQPGDWAQQWAAYRERYPWLVAERDGEVVGVAYAGPYNLREAYDWCAEATIYLRAGVQRAGIGKALYGRLFELLDAQGFVSCTAGVTLPNAGSEGLHAAFGFEPTGVLRSAGFKFGRWWDVGYYQRVLEVPAEPSPLIPVAGVLQEPPGAATSRAATPPVP